MFDWEKGRIKVIFGEHGAIFPYSNNLYLEGREIKALVDAGAGERKLQALKEKFPVERLYLTHYHFDHVVYTYLFKEQAEIWCNPLDAPNLLDLQQLVRTIGITWALGEEKVAAWLADLQADQIQGQSLAPWSRREWLWSTGRVDGTYPYNKLVDLGDLPLQFLHIPGHTAGMACLWFPEQKLVFTADVDLTEFGPWYMGEDGDITAYRQSALALLELPAKYYLTSHVPELLSKDEFYRRLKEYLQIIDQKHEKILALWQQGLSVAEIAGQGIFYPARFQVDPWINAWEQLTIRKHLQLAEGE